MYCTEEIFQSSIPCSKFSSTQVLYLHIEYVWVFFFLLPPSVLNHLRKFNVISPNASHVKVKSRSYQFKLELAITAFCPRIFLLLSYKWKKLHYVQKKFICTVSGRDCTRSALCLRIALDELKVYFKASNCTLHMHAPKSQYAFTV